MSYLNNLDDRIETPLSKLAGDKTLGKKFPAIEKKLNSLEEKWAKRTLTKFNGGKMQVLHCALFKTILSSKTGRGLT